jgi:hypothetical protein
MARARPPTKRTSRYEAREAGLCITDGQDDRQLTNFTATIAEERIIHDGDREIGREYVIDAKHDGQSFRIAVAAADFERLAWIAELGARAQVYPRCRGNTIAGIRELSRPQLRLHYRATGWQERDDGPAIYLHSDGGIGPDGDHFPVAVELSPQLAGYRLPPPGDREDVRATYALTSVAPALCIPLLAAIVRAVLGESRFSVFVFGRTGQGKTAITRLMLSHFGAEIEPVSWDATANALAALAHEARDAALLIDDYNPRDRKHREELETKADQILRAQGNRSARHRANIDGSLNPSDRYPRGLIISTGEELPAGHSLRARLVAVEHNPGADWRISALTPCQRAAKEGTYSGSMAAFLAWIANDRDGRRDDFTRRALAARDQLADGAPHNRTPANIGELLAAIDLWITFAEDIDALTADEALQAREQARAVLADIMHAQAEALADESPAARALPAIRAALARRQAHLEQPDGTAPADPDTWGWSGDQRCGELLGWIKGREIYIDGPPLARLLGQPLDRIRREMDAAGLLTTDERGGKRRRSCRLMVRGQRIDALRLSPSASGKILPLSQETGRDHE